MFQCALSYLAITLNSLKIAITLVSFLFLRGLSSPSRGLVLSMRSRWICPIIKFSTEMLPRIKVRTRIASFLGGQTITVRTNQLGLGV
jgi:hypothetical protein